MTRRFAESMFRMLPCRPTSEPMHCRSTVWSHLAGPVLCVQVKKKMTCDEFLRNNRGINNGQNLPPEFLQAIYASIVRNEIRTTSEAETGAFEVRHGLRRTHDARW